MKVQWAVLLLLLTGLAGCADSGPIPPVEEPDVQDGLQRASGLVPIAPDPATFIGTIVDSHVLPSVPNPTGAVASSVAFFHQLPELHTEAFNLALLDHNALGDGLVGPGSGFIEVDVVGDLALVSSILGSRGATLVDISDPSNLEVLSHIYNLDDNWDARISPDGKYVFLGCQGSGAFDCTGIDESGEQPTITGGGPCASIATCPGGIAVFDIDDPRNPAFEGYLPMGFTHNVYTYMRGELYYFLSANGQMGEWDPASNSLRIASTNVTGSHDIHVQQHPLTGEWLLYSGAGGAGHMGIWNVEDPFEPRLIGFVDPANHNETIPATWHEQSPMPCLIDGRHYTIGAGESGGGVAQTVAVVDTTDPTDPRVVGQWQLPDAESLSGQGMYRYSVHNVDGNCDGQVAIGHYHAGVWVFDISTPERVVNPVTLAYYQPHERPVDAGWTPITGGPIGAVVTADIPNVWAAQWTEDGKSLIIPDMTTGLYALQPLWDFVADE